MWPGTSCNCQSSILHCSISSFHVLLRVSFSYLEVSIHKFVWFCVTSFDILAFLQSENGPNLSIIVVSTVSPGFNSSYKYEMLISDNRYSFFFMTTLHYIWQNLIAACWKHSAGKFYPMRLTHQPWLLRIIACLHRWAMHLLSSAPVRTDIFKKWLDEGSRQEGKIFPGVVFIICPNYGENL